MYERTDFSIEAEAEREDRERFAAREERFTPTIADRKPAYSAGPWIIGRDNQIDGNGGTVVQPGAISWTPDATLIAASPRMLDALRDIRKIVDNYIDGAPDRSTLANVANHVAIIADAALAQVEG